MKLRESKKDYIEIIETTLLESHYLMKRFPEVPMYENIYNQIESLKKFIIENKVDLSKDYVFEHYSLGAIAVKNFDSENDIFAEKLMFIFGLSYKYKDLPNE